MLRTIRARILLLFLLSVGAFVGAMGYSLAQLRTIGEGLEALERGYLPLTQLNADMEAIIRQMERDGERFSRESPRPVAGHRVNADFYSAALEQAVRGARNVAQAAVRTSPPEEAAEFQSVVDLLDAVEVERRQHDEAFDAWMGTAEGNTSAGAALSALGQTRTALALSVGRLTTRVERRIAEVNARTARARERAYAVSIALSAMAAVFSAVLAGVVLVTLRPIATLTAQVQRLGAGEYAEPVRFPVGSVGEEVAVLAREFNAMAAAVTDRDRRLSERATALDTLSLRLRQILDTIRAGLVVLEDGEVDMVNPAAARTWAIRAGDHLPDWMAILPSGRHEAVPLGEHLFDLDVVPFGAHGALIVGEDVTQRVEVRERLARAERLALVGQMLAQITHEVRNPLNAMSLNAELLAEELESLPEAAEMMATIQAEIRRLEHLTARYLSLSRRRTPERTPEDPSTMVRQVLRLEEEALRRAGVTVHLRTPPPGERDLVELDSDALRRALRNLLLNSVEAGATEVAIDVGFPTPATLSIVVRDNGPGMAPDQLRQAFEPFYTTKAQGTGLGLAISRQELEEIGGSLRCESSPGQGSTFTLTCPL